VPIKKTSCKKVRIVFTKYNMGHQQL